jgi:hypothetical protein
MVHLTWLDLVTRVNPFVMAASVIMLCALWLGTRTVFSLPIDLRANWIFRVTPSPGGKTLLAAVRRALLATAVLPVSAVTAVLLARFWPWAATAEHVLLFALLGSLLADASLRGFRKIPFTCSYLPGKTKAHMVFWFGILPLIAAIHHAAGMELHAMSNPVTY